MDESTLPPTGEPGMSGAPGRECANCGRSFRGTRRLCRDCRLKDRECARCGRSFRSDMRLCSACRRTDRNCTSCGRSFKGCQNLCPTCQMMERECTGCGATFKATNRCCKRCRSTLRPCIECGKEFIGTHTRCARCQMTEKECVECGQPFRGTPRHCWRCMAKERDCLGCGRQFRGIQRYCQACWKASLPTGEWQARARAYGNNRRARKLAAQVAGPISPETYAAVRTSGPCVYCGRPATTVDHVRPLTRGGWEHESNLVPACTSCNCSKNDRLLTEWFPERVAHGVMHSAVVAAEFARLAGEAA